MEIVKVYVYYNGIINHLYFQTEENNEDNIEMVAVLESDDFTHLQDLIKVSLVSFGLGQISSPATSINIEEDIGMTFLNDVSNLPFKEIFDSLPAEEQINIQEREYRLRRKKQQISIN